MEKQFGAAPMPIQELRLVDFGREVHVVPPGSERPFNPFLRQWAFPFDLTSQPTKLHAMVGPTPEDFFQSALDCESRAELLPQAIENYQRVVDLAPVHRGSDDRAAVDIEVGPGLPAGCLEVRVGNARSLDGRARVRYRPAEIGRAGLDRRCEPAAVASAAVDRGSIGHATAGNHQAAYRARLASRLGEVNAGFQQLVDGAKKLHKGLTEGAAKLRMVMWLEAKTGLSFSRRPVDLTMPKSDPLVARTHGDQSTAVEKPEEVLLRD